MAEFIFGEKRPNVLSRRQSLQFGLGAAGAIAIPGFFGQLGTAYADDKPPLGTWPAGSQGDSVTIGATVPRTGAYAVQGEDELKGMQLAVEHLNEGHDLIRQIAPKITKGVLDKQVKLVVAELGGQAEQRGAGTTGLHRREQNHRHDGFDLLGGRRGLEQVRPAREDSLSGRHLGLERHDRQGLRALFVPAVLLWRNRRQRDRSGAGEELRQRPEGGVHDARLHLRPYRHEVGERLPEFAGRLDDGDEPGVAARHAGLQPVSHQYRQFRRRVHHQRELGPGRGAVGAAGQAIRPYAEDEDGDPVSDSLPRQGSRRRSLPRAFSPPRTSGGRSRTSIPLAKMFVDGVPEEVQLPAGMGR